jgi:hypothetical protein
MPDDEQAPVDPSSGDSGSGDGAGAAESHPSADEQMKAKYREALAHKHGSSGAHKKVHGDKGEAPHSQSAGPSQKLFRRKAGG